MPPIILAHGALGIYDELVFVSIAVVFVGMMAVSWFRSQQLPDDEPEQGLPPADVAINDYDPSEPEHFELQ